MSDHPRPALTADVVLLRWRGRLEVLLIERRSPPFAGCHALPGGFVDPGEAPARAAVRELHEEAGVDLPPEALHLVGVFGEPGRDPRGWIVSTAWLAFAPPETRPSAGDDAASARWVPLAELPPLAFDHADILDAARRTLRDLTQTGPAPLALLGSGFRTMQARRLYAAIWGRRLPPRPFKAWLRRRALVERIGPARFRAAPQIAPDWER